MEDTIPDEYRRRCSDNAFRAFGTAYIFERRTRKQRWCLRALAFLGIAVPAALGAIIATIGAESAYVGLTITIAGILGIIQLILSIWSLVSKWEDNFAYYLESKSANYRLAEDLHRLATTTTLERPAYEVELRAADTEGDMRANLDEKLDITDKEKALGMRAALRKFQRKCATCGKMPTTLEPTSCNTCGNF
ncbi:MAG: hypothetical protein QM496_10140 [Verrucomicrobiota bacterium]